MFTGAQKLHAPLSTIAEAKLNFKSFYNLTYKYRLTSK